MLELDGFARARGRRVWTNFITEECSVGGEGVECFVLTEGKVKAGRMLRPKAVSDGVMQFDEKQQDQVACCRRDVKCYKGQAASRSNAVSAEGNRGQKKDRAGSDGSGRGESRLEEPGKIVIQKSKECRCSLAFI